MTRKASPRGVFFVGVGHDGTPSAAFRIRARAMAGNPAYLVRLTLRNGQASMRTIKGKPSPAPVKAPEPPRRRIICSAKDIPSSMETLAASWKK